MRSRLITAGILATIAYTVVPYVASRVFGWRVTKSLNSRYVALTFDDGPDPVYTAELLDLLKQEGIQATFLSLVIKQKHIRTSFAGYTTKGINSVSTITSIDRTGRCDRRRSGQESSGRL